jgi:hypothetical protein
VPFSTQLHAATVTLLLGTGCAAKAPPVKSTDEVVAEARTVMDGHMRDQNAFDAPGITERYHSGGTWWLGDGKKEFLSHDSVGKWYAAGAKAAPPVEFEWQDLSFEPVGPDAVVVTGFYVWRM